MLQVASVIYKKRNLFPNIEIGPVVRIAPDQVDICDASAVKEIHKTNSRFAKTVFYRKISIGDLPTTFSTTDKDFHTHHRRLLASPISDSSLTRLKPIIANRIRIAVDKITMELTDHGVTDVFKWWLFMATDIIGELTFGDSFRMLEIGKVSGGLELDKILETIYTDNEYRKINTASTWKD